MTLQTNDVVEIDQLLSLYGHVCDAVVDGASPGRFNEVFTSDAVFDGRSAGRAFLTGVDQIGAIFLHSDRPQPPAHHSTNHYVWEELGSVRALSKWIGIDRETGGFRSGDYVDVLVHTEMGWRISERVVICRWWDGPPPSALS